MLSLLPGSYFKRDVITIIERGQACYLLSFCWEKVTVMEDQPDNNITSLAAYRQNRTTKQQSSKGKSKRTPQRWYVRNSEHPEHFEEVQIIQKPVQGIVRRKSDGQLLHICCRALVSGETKEIIQNTQSLFEHSIATAEPEVQ